MEESSQGFQAGVLGLLMTDPIVESQVQRIHFAEAKDFI
jgi:hypothetical protein